MPVYEYECEKCLCRFEIKRSFGEDDDAVCPHCKGRARRLFSPVPIIFKGSGFYVTDTRSKNPAAEDAKPAKTEDTKPKTETAKKTEKTSGI